MIDWIFQLQYIAIAGAFTYEDFLEIQFKPIKKSRCMLQKQQKTVCLFPFNVPIN